MAQLPSYFRCGNAWSDYKLTSATVLPAHPPKSAESCTHFDGFSMKTRTKAPGDDNLQLIHKTRWGDTARIHLPDGKVMK
jgi:hypothetical protein